MKPPPIKMGSPSSIKSSPSHGPISSSMSYTLEHGLKSSTKCSTSQKHYQVKESNIKEKSMSKAFHVKENSEGHDLSPKYRSQGIGTPSKSRYKFIPPPSLLPSILVPYVPPSTSLQSTYPFPFYS